MHTSPSILSDLRDHLYIVEEPSAMDAVEIVRAFAASSDTYRILLVGDGVTAKHPATDEQNLYHYEFIQAVQHLEGVGELFGDGPGKPLGASAFGNLVILVKRDFTSAEDYQWVAHAEWLPEAPRFAG